VKTEKGPYTLTTANSVGEEALTSSAITIRLFGIDANGTVTNYVDARVAPVVKRSVLILFGAVALILAGRAVNEPDQDRKGDEGQRPNIRGRQRQRRGRAGEEGDQNAPPSLGQYDGMGEASERHGRWADFDGAASGESLSAWSPVTGGGEAGALGGAGAGPSCRRMTGRLPFCRSRLR